MAAKQTVEGSTMSLGSHLKEFRTKLFVVAVVMLLASAVAYAFRDYILYALMLPLDGQKLSYLTPGGGFTFIFKAILGVGFAVTLPVIIFSLYRFIRPALPEAAQKHAGRMLVASVLLLIAGVSFGYFLAVPGAMNFLLTFAEGNIDPMLTGDSYLNFITVYTIGLGVLFQIPLIMLIIHWVKPQRPKKLFSFERYVIVIAFILAALITPTPDIVNQSIIAAPIIVLYQLGVFVILYSLWKTHRRAKKQAKRAAKLAAKQPTPAPAPRPSIPTPAQPERQPVVSVQPALAVAAATTKPARRSIDGMRMSIPARQFEPQPSPAEARPEPAPRPVRLGNRQVDGVRSYSMHSLSRPSFE